MKNLIKKILRESDDFDWIRNTSPSIHSIDDIAYNLNKPFSLFDAETGELSIEATVKNSVYWLEYHSKSPKRYNVCFFANSDGQTRCVVYGASEIVDNFNENKKDNVWVWKFVDTLIGESTDDFDWVRNTGASFDPNLILDLNKKGNVVAIWFDYGIDSSTRDYIISFANENRYDVPYALIRYSNEVKALTFYPDKQMGFLKDEESWDKYIKTVYDNAYIDVSPDNLYVIGR